VKHTRYARAAALLLAVLAACSDAPTGTGITAADQPAALNAAPTSLTVTNSGGHPLISWTAAPGAISYTIQLITYNTLDGQYQNRSFATLGTTTGTSYLTSHTWTGEYSCSMGVIDERYGEPGRWFEYSVQANYSGGSSDPDAARHYAPIAREGCMRQRG
jgi:hypothetical protein